MPQPALHSARHADRDRLAPPVEVARVVALVPRRELLHDVLVVGMRALPSRRRPGRTNREGDDDPLCGAALGARTPLHEGDHRAQHRFRSVEVALVHAQLAAAEADHHVAVAREPSARDALETELAQACQKLLGRARDRRLEAQLELRRLAIAAKKTGQRLKHLVGPGTKPWSDADQTRVDTSISAGERRMLFTDDGHPPRILFDTVPAVEMTVPFFVCSM